MEGEDLLTYEQAAARLNLKLNTLYALVAQSRVPHVRLGRRLVRFSRVALEAWLSERAVVPAAAAARDVRSSGGPRAV
jgi:excisionase family DNA binding protein